MALRFRYYSIHPIFIFDGKAPIIKQKTINKRKNQKQKAKEDFIKLKSELLSFSYNEKKEAELKLDSLRKKFISIKKNDTNQVKYLLDAYGMTYITANYEADELCGVLALNNSVYACMTEDTDIMAYGARKILRYFSLIKHTIVLYDMPVVLQNLHMTTREFQELCVCSGNDYIKTSKNVFDYYKLFKLYKKNSRTSFIEWLLNKQYISLHKYHELLTIYDIYTFKNNNPCKNLPYMIIKNKSINEENLIKILQTAGFIFPLN